MKIDQKRKRSFQHLGMTLFLIVTCFATMYICARLMCMTRSQLQAKYDEAMYAYEIGDYAHAYTLFDRHELHGWKDADEWREKCRLEIYLELGWYHYYDQAYARAYNEFQEVKRLDGDGHNYDYLDPTIEECYERVTENG